MDKEGFSDGYRLLCTCKKALPVSEVPTIKENWPLFLDEHNKHGVVSDASMLKAGLSPDDDLYGPLPDRDTFVVTSVVVTSAHRGRCLTLTNEHLQKMRQQRADSAHKHVERKELDDAQQTRFHIYTYEDWARGGEDWARGGDALSCWRHSLHVCLQAHMYMYLYTYIYVHSHMHICIYT